VDQVDRVVVDRVDRVVVDKVDMVDKGLVDKVDMVVDMVVGRMNCMGYNHCHSLGWDKTFVYTYM
jgi:hypothetical protein